jgi:hypothetical protein
MHIHHITINITIQQVIIMPTVGFKIQAHRQPLQLHRHFIIRKVGHHSPPMLMDSNSKIMLKRKLKEDVPDVRVPIALTSSQDYRQ